MEEKERDKEEGLMDGNCLEVETEGLRGVASGDYLDRPTSRSSNIMLLLLLLLLLMMMMMIRIKMMMNMIQAPGNCFAGTTCCESKIIFNLLTR